MSVKQLISKATRVSYTAKLGLFKDDSGNKRTFDQVRPTTINADFPDLYLIQHGKARFINGKRSIVLANDALVVESSFGYQLSRKIDPLYVSNIEEEAVQYKSSGTPLDGDVFVAINEGSGTWGHWFGQILPVVIEFLKNFPDGKVIVPRGYFSHSYYGNFGQLAVMAGVDINSFILARPDDIFDIENLVTYDYFFSNGVFHPKSLENLHCLTLKNIKRNGNVFIERLDQKNRNIENIVEIEEINLKNKIKKFCSGSSDLLNQQNIWANSSLNIGVLGSDFTSMFFGTTGRVLILTPGWFGDRFFFGIAAALGYEWNELRCNTYGEKKVPERQSSFYIDSDAYREMVESILLDCSS